jgi:hypothetical protein
MKNSEFLNCPYCFTSHVKFPVRCIRHMEKVLRDTKFQYTKDAKDKYLNYIEYWENLNG